MKADSARIVYQLLRNSDIMRGAKRGDDRFLKNLLGLAGIDNPQADDIADLKSFISSLDPVQTDTERTTAESMNNEAFRDRLDNARRMSNALDSAWSLDPKALAIRAAGKAAVEGVRAAGNIAANNGNRLAQAILSASRGTASDEQVNRFGRTGSMIGGDMYAQNRMRQGENTKAVTDAVANVGDALLGTYNMYDNMKRAEKAHYLTGEGPLSGMAQYAMTKKQEY